MVIGKKAVEELIQKLNHGCPINPLTGRIDVLLSDDLMEIAAVTIEELWSLICTEK